MSSPAGNNGGPPPDGHTPPRPSQSTDTPDAQQSAPPPTAEPNGEAPTSSSAEAASADTPAPHTGSSPPSGSRRRPLSTLSFFYPYPFRNGEGENAENGERMGLQWTLEVFANDGSEDPTDGGQAPAPPGASPSPAAPTHLPGDANAPPAPQAEGAAAAGAGMGTGVGGEGEAQAGAGRGQGQDGQAGPPPQQARSVFFIVGPDGRLIPRPGTEQGMGPPPIWPFFPFGFSMAPATPDPAKAAELLASLPTVGRALLRRVDKVVAAEDANVGKEYDDRGWRCGICLEGMDGAEEEAEEAAGAKPVVKALPCNHLFHEDCVQPWFTNHHTCPTCRLDLDPLRTLEPPRETRRNPLRPSATGSGRATPANHPYSRDRDRPEAAAVSDATTTQQPQQGATQPQATDDSDVPAERRHAMNIFDAALDMALGNFGRAMASPLPMSRPASAQEATQAGDASSNGAGSSTESAPNGVEGAAEASSSGAPTTTAPGEGRPASAPPLETTGSQAANGDATPSGAPPRPTPERRQHITIITVPTPPSQSPPPPQAEPSNPSAATGNAPNVSNANPNANATNTNEPNATPTPSTDAAPAADTNAPTPGAQADAPGPAATPGGGPPRVHLPITGMFPFDLFFMGPPRTHAPPTEPAAPEQPPAQTFVPQSLENWTEQREKTLGWRCDAVECLIAPPIPDNSREDTMDIDEPEDEQDEPAPGDKEMLSIYAPTQPPFPPRAPNEQPHQGHDFVLLACEHRWHRACLETAERSAGHSLIPDAENREWIRCQRCRKEGWIAPRIEGVPRVEGVAI